MDAKTVIEKLSKPVIVRVMNLDYESIITISPGADSEHEARDVAQTFIVDLIRFYEKKKSNTH